MITYRKAKQLLAPGDVVYATNGKQIVPAQIRKIGVEYLDTDVDVLYFEDHGILWWLTKRVAKEKVHAI